MLCSSQLAAGRQWLDFNSTRKSCGVFSFPSYQSSPFYHLDISDTVVLKTRYYIGHIVQVSKSDPLYHHSKLWKVLFSKLLKTSPMSPFGTMSQKKKNPFSLDCMVLVCLLMRSFQRLYSFPLFFIKASVWQFKSLLSHIKPQTVVSSQQPVIGDISQFSGVVHSN